MRYTNHKYVQSIMDLAARRPDLSISDIERLIERAESAPAKKPRDLSNTQIRLRAFAPIWVGGFSMTAAIHWLSGAGFERSPVLAFSFISASIVCSVVTAILMHCYDDDACEKIRRQSKEK